MRKFFQKLKCGEEATVAYFGGSITWGATATDPLKTSWRALLAKRLQREFPAARLVPVDAAIGGKGSDLGVFRMDRDVLPFRPDLTFVEFAVNDAQNPERLECMEGILRKLHTGRPDMAIVLVITGYGTESFESPREEDYRSLAAYYGIPAISVVPEVRRRIAAGEFSCRDRRHSSERSRLCPLLRHHFRAADELRRLRAVAGKAADRQPVRVGPDDRTRFAAAPRRTRGGMEAGAAVGDRRLVRSPAVALASERHRSGAGNGLPLSGNRVFRCRRLLRDGSGRRPVRASGRRGEHICRRHEIPLAVSGAREPFSTAARCGKAYDYSESARPEPAAGLSAADRTVNRLE